MKISITLEDQEEDGEVNINFKVDPPVTAETENTPAFELAAHAMKAIRERIEAVHADVLEGNFPED